MIVYLNRGFIPEQAVKDLIERFLRQKKYENIFTNFTVNVTLQHPFAEIFLSNNTMSADFFPAIVVSTVDDTKPAELMGLTRYREVGLDETDVQEICNINDEEGKQKAGIPLVAAQIDIEQIKQLVRGGIVYGISQVSYRRERISIEIWGKNKTVVNQLYEDVRLFILHEICFMLEKKYVNDIKIDEEDICGQRGGAYNVDFGVVLNGANITFDMNYTIEHIRLDTDLKPKELNVISAVQNVIGGKNEKKNR